MIKSDLSKEAKKLRDEKIAFDSQVEEYENAQFEIGEAELEQEELETLEQEYNDLLCAEYDEENNEN